MKKCFLFLFFALVGLSAFSQVYNPSLHATVNKSLGMAQAGPTDARSYFYDENFFVYRPFVSVEEVKSYLTLPKYRTGQFDIVVNTGGSLNNGVITGGTNVIWYFKDGITDDDLVLKGGTSSPTLFGVQDNTAAENRIFDLNNFALDIHTGITSESVTFQKGVFSALAADAITPSNRSSIQLNASAGASTSALISEFAGGHIASFSSYTDGSHSNMVFNLGADPDLRITGLNTATTANIFYYNNITGQTTWGALPVSNNASALTTGTVADARLTANVPLKNTANTFTADQTFPNILLPATTSSTTGIVFKNSLRFMHNWTDPDIIADGDNTFLGTLAGNFTMGDAGGGGAIGGRNTGVGYHALTANTTGWQNTAIGHISQQANTTGLYNTSVGAYSLAVNTTGANNTAIGSDAMWLNQTGGANVAVGTYGMQQNTTGDNNVGLGYKALFVNTTGANNIAIGSEALAAATTFSYNIAIGHNAMKNSNAISSNVGIGAFAMFAVSGSENTAVGTFGLQSITTGAGNTAIGYGANSTATTGNFGTYIGGQSAWNLTTGGRNTFIGYKSGYNADTESDNVVIGYDQRLKFDAEDGQLNIQSIIFGRGNTGNNATLSTGKIGIGVVDPQARLAITSTTEQLRTGYDASNYESKTVSSVGAVTYDAVGSGAKFIWSDDVAFSTNATLADYTSTTTPAAPADGIKVFSRERTGRNLLSVIGERGKATALQPAMFSNKIGYVQSRGGSSATADVWGINATANTAAVGATTTFNGNLFVSTRRTNFPTTSTAGTIGGMRNNSLQWSLGDAAGKGGFFLVVRGGIAAFSTDMRGFIGMWGTASAFTNVEASSLTNLLAFGFDAADTQWFFMHNDGSGTATKETLNGGTGLPCKTTAADFYEFRIYAPSNGSTVYYSIENISTGVYYEGSVATDLPANIQGLSYQLGYTNNATASVVSFDLSSLYIESEN